MGIRPERVRCELICSLFPARSATGFGSYDESEQQDQSVDDGESIDVHDTSTRAMSPRKGPTATDSSTSYGTSKANKRPICSLFRFETNMTVFADRHVWIPESANTRK